MKEAEEDEKTFNIEKEVKAAPEEKEEEPDVDAAVKSVLGAKLSKK